MHRVLLYGLVAWLGVIAAPRLAGAQAGEPLKPYILFIADVSGSMNDQTGHGSPSCAQGDSRLNHLKCAIDNIVNGYGDMLMGLGRFRLHTSDNNCSNGCGMNGVDCEPCSDSGDCTPEMSSGDRFELLVPLVEDNQRDLLEWVNFTCGTCYNDQANDPEIDTAGWTPIAGSLKGAKRYFQGLSTPGVDSDVGEVPYWTGPGSDPIRDDPLNDVFVDGAQCRPYIVIMLTDGDETCVSDFSETTDAAAALLSTEVDGRTYRIETKPIGFGQSLGDSQIEALAHAGGTPDGAGYEGFYAQNEDELSLAISQIISDALKFEMCNEVDDDCDLLVDEGFESKGAACDDGQFGICKGTGTLQCSADGAGLECVIDTPGQPATVESCNGLDDDCDQKVDEGGVCAGCSNFELCDGLDNDCDDQVDEDLTRTCGTDVGECQSGVETCTDGTWQGCTAVFGSPELCDGLDNDCDGTVDGFAQECVTLPGNNPGEGTCRAGTQVCPSDGSGVFGPCLGEVGPDAETCDLVDNDCDSLIDEDTGGDACNGSCGVGITECVDGTIVCNSVVTPGDEMCDGLDNDCDSLIDEDVPSAGPCDGDGTLCEPGELTCINGTYECVGGVEIMPESCDCKDNDCDTRIDEEPPAVCPPGASCVSCQCAFPCAGGEFPCPPGRYCSPDNFCLIDPCYGVECPPADNGDKMECVDGECVRSCDLITCPGEQICLGSEGVCAFDDCRSFPEYCTGEELCVEGVCVANPCAGVDCPEGQYCVDGACADSCADVTCPEGERCVLGQCEVDACGGSCAPQQVCNQDTGECEGDPCAGVDCAPGEECNPDTVTCEQDPCLGVVCPEPDQVCEDGSCFTQDQLDPEPDYRYDYVTAAGSGGCSATGGAPGPGGVLLALLALLAAGRRQRREGGDHA